VTQELAAFRHAEFDLETLVSTARGTLRRARFRIEDGRVADAPDARGVRYYQTLGLLDRPLRYDGRRAIYGYRHLLQLLAIRRLQGEGYPLAVIQSTLPAQSTSALEASLARIFDAGLAGSSGEGAAAAGAGALAQPDEVAPPQASVPLPRRVLSGEVAPGITLTIDPGRVAGADDIYARVAEYVERLMKEA
jgi:DNA-binding transcriptional MerR regulator